MSIVVLLAGCTQTKAYYDRTGGTPAMFERDSSECKSRAHKASTMKSGSYPSSGREPGHGSGEGLPADVQYYREYDKCLEHKGWKKVSKPQQ